MHPGHAGEIFRAADPSWSVAECCDASGTTATLAIANAYELTVAHVGDSLALLITADADGVLHGALDDIDVLRGEIQSCLPDSVFGHNFAFSVQLCGIHCNKTLHPVPDA